MKRMKTYPLTLFTAITMAVCSMSLSSCGDEDNDDSLTEDKTEKELYFTVKDKVITYYYDNRKEERKELIPDSITPPVTDMIAFIYKDVPISVLSGHSGYDGVQGITKIVLDPSIINYRPTSLREFFLIDAKRTATSIEGLQYLNTSEVKDMSGMFAWCSELKHLDLSTFDTRNVEDMSYMFENCSSLIDVNLSSFNTKKVKNMQVMFLCESLERIYVGDGWTTESVTPSIMFVNCDKLVGEKGTTFKGNQPNNYTYAHVDGGESYPGYMTYKAKP